MCRGRWRAGRPARVEGHAAAAPGRHGGPPLLLPTPSHCQSRSAHSDLQAIVGQAQHGVDARELGLGHPEGVFNPRGTNRSV